MEFIFSGTSRIDGKIFFFRRKFRAGDETRTHDPQLGRLMLYQLSYARKRINLR